MYVCIKWICTVGIFDSIDLEHWTFIPKVVSIELIISRCRHRQVYTTYIVCVTFKIMSSPKTEYMFETVMNYVHEYNIYCYFMHIVFDLQRLKVDEICPLYSICYTYLKQTDSASFIKSYFEIWISKENVCQCDTVELVIS